MKIDELVAKLQEYRLKYGNIDIIDNKDMHINNTSRMQDPYSTTPKLVIKLY